MSSSIYEEDMQATVSTVTSSSYIVEAACAEMAEADMNAHALSSSASAAMAVEASDESDCQEVLPTTVSKGAAAGNCKRLKTDEIWKSFLRTFRHVITDHFAESGLARGKNSWSASRLIK